MCLLRHTRGCCTHFSFVPTDLLSSAGQSCFRHKCVWLTVAAGSMKMPPADHYLFNKGFCVHSSVEATCFVPVTVYSVLSLRLLWPEAKSQPHLITICNYFSTLKVFFCVSFLSCYMLYLQGDLVSMILDVLFRVWFPYFCVNDVTHSTMTPFIIKSDICMSVCQ